MGGWISVSGITGRAQVGHINLELVTKEVGLDEMTRERKEDQNQASDKNIEFSARFGYMEVIGDFGTSWL